MGLSNAARGGADEQPCGPGLALWRPVAEAFPWDGAYQRQPLGRTHPVPQGNVPSAHPSHLSRALAQWGRIFE